MYVKHVLSNLSELSIDAHFKACLDRVKQTHIYIVDKNNNNKTKQKTKQDIIKPKHN